MKFLNIKHILFLLLAALPVLHPLQAQIRINEILAINSTVIHDPDFGEFSDFVELHNASAHAIQLAGYTLTDDAADKNKWELPALTLLPGQYLLIWTDGRDKHPGDTAFVAYKNAVTTMTALHANFRLSGGGEYLALFNQQGQKVDEVVYYTQTDDISFGRNAAEWQYLGEVTPGAANSAYGSATMERAGEPVFSLSEGFYAAPQVLQVSSSEPGAVIRFSFDGSTPNSQSPVFPANFPLNLTLSIKARLFVPGKMPGNVVTKTYFIHETPDLPVLSISTSAAHLYGFDFGILQNAIKDREVPATIEYFEPQTGERAFLSVAGLRVFGTSIYNLPQRPISVRFRAKYGDDALKYPLFAGKPIPAYSSFLLRNGGNDYNNAFFRDGLAVNLVKGKMNLDYQDYQPCVVFINGEYNGVYELRERLDEAYIGNNHLVNPDDLDYLEDSLQVVAGAPHQFADLMKFVRENDLADPDAYARVAASVDLDEFTNYLIHRAFIGYQIADLNNRFWRSREPGSKWRWIAADMEHAFGQLGGDPYTENTLAKLIGLPGNLPEWATMLFNRLLDHPDFRAVFIQRSAAWLNTIYQPDVTLAAVDSLAGLLAPHMPRHIGRWNTPPSIPAWQGNIQLIKTFLQHRPAHYRRHLTELFGAPDSVRVSFEIAGQGRVVVSGVPFSANTEGYFFKNTAIHLQAIPAPGFRFVAWQGLNSANDHTTFIPLGDTAFVAVFVPQNISIIPPLVEADTTLAASASPWYGLENIRVLPGARLRVEAGATLLMTDGVSIEVQGGLYLEGTADRRISVLSDPAPSARRSFYGQAGYWGAIWAENAGDSLVFQYADLLNGSFGPDRSRHFSTISTYNCRLRVENSRVLQGKAPLIARGGSAVLRHSEFHTPVSCNGFISLYDMNAPLIEHCVFRGNRAINTDGIDLKGISHAVVRYNHVYGFLGDNCDGIDFGIYSLNNLVEYNIIHDCSDKGISIGSQSNVLVRRNLIYDCDLGVALKDSLAVAHIDQNTFYGNRIAVACYEKSALRGGGKAFVKNSILAASGESGIFYDDQSEIQVSYSLSDREGLPGTGNLYADPAMIHPSTGNFELAGHSPCINTGDPFSPFDPDGSRADMGAYYTHTGDYGLSLHVNEFNYHPPFNYSCGDWIELHNSSDQSIDLKGWRMAQGLQFFEFETPALLAPGGYLVVCEDTARFAAFYPETVLKIGNSRMDFDNKSGKITLIDPTGRQVHCVRYADDRPWPPLADGRGATVELAQGQEGNLPVEWRESYVLLGTPGGPNSLPPDVSGLSVNEVLASNVHTLADEAGEYDDWFELYNTSGDTLNIGGLCFSDDAGNPCKWQAPLHFPGQTTLPPYGFMLLWADEQPEQGVLHADFKLSAGGETVGVYQRSETAYTVVEQLEFGPQSADISRGRYPDGGTEIAFMSPTPGASNLLSGADPVNLEVLRVYPNPFSQALFVHAENVEKPYNLFLVNALGQTVAAIREQYQETAVLRRDALPAGLYTVILLDAKGRRWVVKVSKEER